VPSVAQHISRPVSCQISQPLTSPAHVSNEPFVGNGLRPPVRSLPPLYTTAKSGTVAFPGYDTIRVAILTCTQKLIYHHHNCRVAGEGRRVVASPCPRSTARLQGIWEAVSRAPSVERRVSAAPVSRAPQLIITNYLG